MVKLSKSEIRRLKSFNEKCKKASVLTSYLLKDINDFEEIVVPEGIKVIDFTAFNECSNLKRVILPSSLVKIDYGAFSGLSNLEEIDIPDSVMSIGKDAFSGCTSLKRIKLPNSLLKIEKGAFYKCDSLKSIVIPDNVFFIETGAFYGCSSLEKVSFGDNLRYICANAFGECISLKNIKFSDKLEEIGMFSFAGCSSLENVSFRDNMVNIDESSFVDCPKLIVDNFISKYLFKTINLICKRKYSSFKEIYAENPNIRDVINYVSLCYSKSENDSNVLKFKNLLYKTRINDMVSLDTFKSFNLSDTYNFDYKFWKKIDNYADISNGELAFIKFMGIFGLFEKDRDLDRRKDLFIKIISNMYKNYFIFSDLVYLTDDYLCYFDKVLKPEYVLKKGVLIPNEFSLYLDEIMVFNKVNKLKKIDGTFGARLNKFIKNNYDVCDKYYFVLKDGLSDSVLGDISKHLYNVPCYGVLNASKVDLLFKNIDSSYDKEFLDFFISNLDLILLEIDNFDTLSLIKKSFLDIKRFYLNFGKEKIDFYDCVKYLNTYKFNDALFGDERFISMFHESGAPSKGFSFYREQYNKVKKKYKSTLPKTDIVFNYGNNKIRIRRLDANDPMQIFIGEVNYTNCCLVYDDCAESCISGISESDSMGVTVVELLTDDNTILLAQSLDWTRNGVYCHDNIEGTKYLEAHSNLEDVVFKAYKCQAKEIIAKSLEMVSKCLENTSDLEYKRMLVNQMIKAVVIGDCFNCIDISSLEPSSDLVNSLFSEYICYSDSGSKRLLFGNVDEFSQDGLFNEDDKQIAIFKESRKIYHFDETNITDEELLCMNLIEESSNCFEYKNFDYGDNRDLHLDSFSLLCERIGIDSSLCKVVLGEDFYIIYSVLDGDVFIHDLKVGLLRDKSEKLEQLIELKNAIYKIIGESLIFDGNSLTRGKVTSLVNKDNSRLLYLFAKDLGIICDDFEDGDLVSFRASDKYVKRHFLK